MFALVVDLFGDYPGDMTLNANTRPSLLITGTYLQFRALGSGGRISINGPPHNPLYNRVVRLVVGTVGLGGIYATTSTVDIFTFDDVSLYAPITAVTGRKRKPTNLIDVWSRYALGPARTSITTMMGRERPSEIRMVRYQLTAVVREEDGVYVSRCLELEVASCGDTPKEALAMLRDAVDLYRENAEAYGMPTSLPDPAAAAKP